MKIYMTSYILDGDEYAGPQIHAESFDSANNIAEEHGLTVCGELTDILQSIVEDHLMKDLDNRVLH
tara:strand:- start:638 stop:835 length:198 start_codon:yes stop_codon:yes gene_type:complete